MREDESNASTSTQWKCGLPEEEEVATEACPSEGKKI